MAKNKTINVKGAETTILQGENPNFKPIEFDGFKYGTFAIIKRVEFPHLKNKV